MRLKQISMGISLFFQLFAGVSMNESDEIPLVPLGRWLFPIGIYLLLFGFLLGRNRQNQRFAIVRYGWIQKWWRHHFLRNISYGIVTAAGLLMLFQIIDLFAIRAILGNLKEIAVIFALWIVHAMTLSALFLLLEILKMKRLIPMALLLLEGFTFLNGFRFRTSAKYMFGMWGMYVQSNSYEGMYGFSVASVMIAQATIITICYWLGSHWLNSKGMEGA